MDEAPATSSPWTGKDVLLIVLGILAVLLAALLALRLWAQATGAEIEPSNLLSTALGLLEGVALIGSVYLLGIRRRGLGWDAVGLRLPSLQWFIRSLWLGLAAIPLSALTALLVQLLLNRPVENVQLEFLAPEGFSWFAALSMLVLGGFVAPFAEELFFRAVLYPWMRARWGVLPGMLVSGVLFGAVHGEISVAAAAALLGFLLAWVYERSSSLWPPVIIHVINNAFKILLLYALIAAGAPLE